MKNLHHDSPSTSFELRRTITTADGYVFLFIGLSDEDLRPLLDEVGFTIDDLGPPVSELVADYIIDKGIR